MIAGTVTINQAPCWSGTQPGERRRVRGLRGTLRCTWLFDMFFTLLMRIRDGQLAWSFPCRTRRSACLDRGVRIPPGSWLPLPSDAEASRDAVLEQINTYSPDAVVCIGFPFGHTRAQWIIPHGGMMTVDSVKPARSCRLLLSRRCAIPVARATGGLGTLPPACGPTGHAAPIHRRVMIS